MNIENSCHHYIVILFQSVTNFYVDDSADFEMALLIEVETVKELFFGGAFGLCAGIAARYVHSHTLKFKNCFDCH